MPRVSNADAYWESRILADEEQAHRIADHASEEMAKVYRAQYLRVVKRVEELRDKLDYGKQLTRTELWNYARWTKVEESLRGYVSESSRINTDIIHKALDAEFKRVIGDESKNFGGALGRGGVMKLSPEAQQRILAGTWSGEHYSSRIWKNTAALADRMKNEITEMLVDGKSMPDIRRRLMYEFNVSYNNADRLARTEVSYVHNQATLERYRASGATQLKVLIVEDGKTCDKCQALADQPYSIDKPPMVPVHPRCRCCYAPWTYTDRKEWAKKHPEEQETPLAKAERAVQQMPWTHTFNNGSAATDLPPAPGSAIIEPPDDATDEDIYEYLRSDAVNTQVIPEKQQVHMQGPLYIAGRSYIINTLLEDIQRFVDKHHGAGELSRSRSGKWQHAEVVEADEGELEGVSIDQKTQEETPTKHFKIHYRKTGVHVVPIKPKDKHGSDNDGSERIPGQENQGDVQGR